jgi:hypothetical protein
LTARQRDLVCGFFFALLGMTFVIGAWSTLPVGRAFAMGPGYFPIVMGVVLTGLGLLIVGKATTQGGHRLPPVAWVGTGLIIGAVLVFGLTARGAGLAPALLVSTFMAAMATGRMSVAGALLLSAVLTTFTIGVFVYGIRLPYPVIGPWLGG